VPTTVLIHAAAGVTTICAAEKIVLTHDPSSKPRLSAPRMSARPCVVIRALRVEMNAPTNTATTPMTGYSRRLVAGSGIGAARVVAGTVMMVAEWCR
jgi:hypothetical protein